MTQDAFACLRLLQLASPALPVGAYSYSEGLESLVDRGVIHDLSSLQHWLEQELHYGTIRIEAAVMVRAYAAVQQDDDQLLHDWNEWVSAFRETEELRLQSWQMGRSLLKLLLDTHQLAPQVVDPFSGDCNFAIAFALAAYHWQIELAETVLGYLYSWANNLISAGVKLIPLGQTAGQQLLLNLTPTLSSITDEILTLTEDQLYSCGWGLALASMAHETLYSRLFRS
jgi:urease accessory protein